MIDLKTTYMGIELKNPIIAGASELSSDMEKIKKIEKAGAGALVIKSLFEEQIQLETYKFDEEQAKYDELHAEMITVHPDIEHAGPAEHLMWVRKAKEAVKIPVIGSLNCVNKDTWIEYAKKLTETGIDGLELNFYTVPTNFDKSGDQIENEQIEILKAIKQAVSIPVSVKLSTFYSNPLNFISKIDKVGVNGFVLFNQFFQPDINITREANTFPFNLSQRKDHRLPLRFSGLLYNKINGDVCASTGIMQGEDVIKMILAGADCVQVVSTLYKNKIDHISKMLDGMEQWMDQKGYKSLDDFRGKLSQKNMKDPWVYKRAQYIRLLLNANPID